MSHDLGGRFVRVAQVFFVVPFSYSFLFYSSRFDSF